MYFVIQVMSKTENALMNQIKNNFDSSLVSDVFIPIKERMKKINGKWVKTEEKFFPGYIFVETSKPKEVAKQLRKIEGFTRLVGFGDVGKINYVPLSKKDEEMINSLLARKNKESIVKLSKIYIDEGKKVKIMDGPLLGFEGTLIKYNLHKRTALVDVDFNGKVISVQLGIDIVKKIK